MKLLIYHVRGSGDKSALEGCILVYSASSNEYVRQTCRMLSIKSACLVCECVSDARQRFREAPMCTSERTPTDGTGQWTSMVGGRHWSPFDGSWARSGDWRRCAVARAGGSRCGTGACRPATGPLTQAGHTLCSLRVCCTSAW